jgi:hypothetical protein
MWDDPDQPPAPRWPQSPGTPGSPYADPTSPYAAFEPPPTGGAPGYGPDGRADAYDPYDPYGRTQQGGGYNQPPAQQTPGGRPPQWPAQDYAGAAAGYGAPPPAYAPPPQPAYAPAPRPYTPPARQAATRAERPRAERGGRSLPHLPIAHVLLAVGLVAMGYAITQPWGVDAQGTQIFVHDFGNARLTSAGIDGGTLAVRAATAIVIAAAVLSLALILLNTVVTVLNHILGIVGLSGCASLAFFPVLWGLATLLFVVLLGAAGFAGLGALSNLPVVQSHGFGVVPSAQHTIGFYLWSGGIGAVFVGMLGQLVLRRR